MKRPIIIGIIAALALLTLGSCSGNGGAVTQNSTPLSAAPVPSALAPTAPSPTTTVPTAPQKSSATTLSVGNQVGNLAPDFQLNDLAGKPVSLKDFRGKPVLLNFWATW